MSSFDDADAWDPFAEQEPIETQVADFLEEAELSYPLLVLEGTAAADVSLSPVRQALPVAVAVDQATSPSVTLEKPELPTCPPPPRKRLRGSSHLLNCHGQLHVCHVIRRLCRSLMRNPPPVSAGPM